MKARPHVQKVDLRKVAMSSSKGLDEILRDWGFDPHTLSVRLVKNDEGRDVIQMRVDLGVLQMETQGRPDPRFRDGSRSNAGTRKAKARVLDGRRAML